MLHQMHHAQSCKFVTLHLDEVVTDFVLFGASSLDQDLLLLVDRSLEHPHPVEDVPVASGQLVSLANLDHLVQRCLVFVVGQLERKFFNLELPFE